MANEETLAKLKEDILAWNERRWKTGEDVDLQGADLSQAALGQANLHDANICDANLRGADLGKADLRRALFIDADLMGANLSDAILLHADLSGADLSDTDLSGAILSDANLVRAKLSGAKLMRAKLAGANLHGVDLHGANLRGADLSDANLSDAHLIGANLSEARLSHANLRGADLSNADLTRAEASQTIFGNTNLSNVIGLDSCNHFGPSVIDEATITLSRTLPLPFLRGCGVSESLITYLPSLLNQPIQFYSCFISHSTIDQEFADRLHADLQNKGVRCWFAPHDMVPGKKIHEQIDEAIRLHDKLLLILSEHSMNSEWVKTEIRKARKREIDDKRRMLFPVSLVGFKLLKKWECFDAEIGKDSAVEIREFFIPDFSTWKTNHDAYKQNLERLVTSLQTEADMAVKAP